MIEAVTRALFDESPQETLYHYTSLTGCLGIIGSRELRSSDIRYMNDSTELRHTLDLLNKQVTKRILAGVDNPTILNSFLDWLSRRIVSGPMLFGASFRANGNLLSQWRGYSAHGSGVSLGFSPSRIAQLASAQGFSVGRCVYQQREQTQLIEQLIDGVEMLALSQGINTLALNEADALFQPIEEDLLRTAAILKHPAFEEEQEWRIVSPVVRDPRHRRVNFREGASMLVPYYAFWLGSEDEQGVALNHVFIGPTQNADLSMNSLRLYLEQMHSVPRDGIAYCQIPYRKK